MLKPATPNFKKTYSKVGQYATLCQCHVGVILSASGDRAKSAAVYKDFLALWKDAEPDTSVFKQAKAEYARFCCFQMDY